MKKSLRTVQKKALWPVSIITAAICLLLNVNAIAQAPPPTDPYVANVLDYGAVGNCTLVNNHWIGTDNTAAIQAAIDDVSQNHPGGTVLVPDGTYLVTKPAGSNEVLNLKSNITFKMTNGATIQLKENNAWGYFILYILNITNVNVIGGTVHGERHQHLSSCDDVLLTSDPGNQNCDGQWGYGICIQGSSNIYIEGVQSREMWGDGFNVGIDAQNTNLNFYNVVADDNRRQGMSVGWVDGLVIRNSVFKNTRGHWPMAGIDIETDRSYDHINNVEISGCTFSNNHSTGVKLYNNNGGATVNNLTVTDNAMSGGFFGVYFNGQVSGALVNNNTTTNNSVDGIRINGNTSVNNTYSNNTITASAALTGDHAGIRLMNGATGNTLSSNCISGYYYRIRDEVGGNVISGSCPTDPVLAVDPSSLSFGTLTKDSISPEQSYTLTGNNLFGNVTVTSAPGYLISTTSGTGFKTQLTITPISGNVSQPIYVRFEPRLAKEYNGNILNSNAGDNITNVAVTGVGTVPTGIGTTIKNENVIVSPNPFHTSFRIKISSGMPIKNAAIKIYDMNGKEVKTVLINQNETTVSRKGMENGVYFYGIFNDNEKIGDGKLIVQ